MEVLATMSFWGLFRIIFMTIFRPFLAGFGIWGPKIDLKNDPKNDHFTDFSV